MFGLYLVPMETLPGAFLPKYFYMARFPARGGIVCSWGCMRYGYMPLALVVAYDITEPDAAWLEAQPDVYPWPSNLDQAIAGNDPVKAYLESAKVPTAWTTAATTYRELLRCLAGLFQFAQRYQGISGQPLFSAAVTLDSRYRDLTAQERTWFQATITSFGYDIAPNPNQTLRTLAKAAGDAWGSKPFYMGDLVF